MDSIATGGLQNLSYLEAVDARRDASLSDALAIQGNIFIPYMKYPVHVGIFHLIWKDLQSPPFDCGPRSILVDRSSSLKIHHIVCVHWNRAIALFPAFHALVKLGNMSSRVRTHLIATIRLQAVISHCEPCIWISHPPHLVRPVEVGNLCIPHFTYPGEIGNELDTIDRNRTIYDAVYFCGQWISISSCTSQASILTGGYLNSPLCIPW